MEEEAEKDVRGKESIYPCGHAETGRKIMSLPGRGGMDAPKGGSVLDRVKMFLPVIAAANEELQQKIMKEGQEAVQIDSHLNEPEASTEAPLDSKMITEDDESSDEEDNTIASNNDNTEPQIEKIVELNFALGDFDETNIALLEELGKEDEEENNDEEQNNEDDDS